MLSFHNVVARYAFAMGREGLLPAAFGRTNRSSGAPGTGSLLQTAVVPGRRRRLRGHRRQAGGRPDRARAAAVHLDGQRRRARRHRADGGGLRSPSSSSSSGAAPRGAQAWRLIACSALAGLALLVIAVYTVKDFDVLRRRGPGLLAAAGCCPASSALAVVVGVGLRPRPAPAGREVHARIGLGNEAFQLEKAAESPSRREPETAG